MDTYSELIGIKEIGNNCLTTAIWKEGPLYCFGSHEEWIRNSYKEVVLRFLYDTQNITDEFTNKVESYLLGHDDHDYNYYRNNYYGHNYYGISQNPDTKVYILVFNDKYPDYYCGKCGDKYTRRKKQLKYDGDDAVFEWIPYSELINIREIGNNCLTTMVWKKGPLYCKYYEGKNEWMRKSYEDVVLRFLYDTQNITDELNKIESYLLNKKWYNIKYEWYGISQNPNTKVYILAFSNAYLYYYCKKCEKQLKVKTKDDTVFEWIQYNEFIEIKETGKDSRAIWKKGTLCYNTNDDKLIRESYKKVYLKYLYNIVDITDEFLNMVESFLKNGRSYGISQNPDTKVYILIFDNNDNRYFDRYWTDGNAKVDDFIQKLQSKINKDNDTFFGWIPYNKFIEINEEDRESGFATAILKFGPSFYNTKEIIMKKLYEKVYLKKYLHGSNEIELHLKNGFVFGISQNPDTKDYIWIFNNKYFEEYCEKCSNRYEDKDNKWCNSCQINYLKNNFTNWTSGNNKLDEFIQQIQLKINNYYDSIFEWIPYHELININEIRKGIFTAMWKDGSLCYSKIERKYKRKLNEKVLIKCLYNSQNINNLSLNEIAYSIEESYGVSQNPNTKDFILILQFKYYCENCGEKYNNQFEIDSKNCMSCQTNHESNKIKDLIQEIRLNVNHESNMIFEWISYDQLVDVKEIGKGGFSTVYSAIWKDGLLTYNGTRNSKYWNRESNTKVALKCLHNSQNFLDKFIDEVKAYPNQKIKNILEIYGVSQNPQTKDYIMVFKYAEGGNLNKNYNLNWQKGLKILSEIINGLGRIHQKHLVHHDLHAGNILIMSDEYDACISDMGLCRKIDDINETSIYGVMPYVAPEVLLKGKLYTQAADIYSFVNRPNYIEIKEIVGSFQNYHYYKFVKLEKTREKKFLSIKNNQSTIHTQAIYTSRLLNPFIKNLSKYDDISNDNNMFDKVKSVLNIK
ncbi:kinase-like domain-containing protein [Rhizophagus clarus]|uniref:Kinase-like domain-containing protein n=1 Tax=Rhizophagus clarus TaxID=94130 RepID=A0A8H3LUV0_9GLOM|nr:kinase-like domain-containing protein [Rhizophagus clarus]